MDFCHFGEKKSASRELEKVKSWKNGRPERIRQVQRLYGGRCVHKLHADKSVGNEYRGKVCGSFFLCKKLSSNRESTLIDFILGTTHSKHYAIPGHILGMQSPNDPIHRCLHKGARRRNRWNLQNGNRVGVAFLSLHCNNAGDAVLARTLHMFPQ